jgi:hypothetical protein
MLLYIGGHLFVLSSGNLFDLRAQVLKLKLNSWPESASELYRPPLWSSDQSSRLHNGDVLCFL